MNERPSLSVSVFVCWVVPVVLIAIASRFAVDTTLAAPKTTHSIPSNLFDESTSEKSASSHAADEFKAKDASKGPSVMPTVLANKPSSYVEIVGAIRPRRLDWEDVSSDPVEGYERRPRVQTTASSSAPLTGSDRRAKSSGSEQSKLKQSGPKTTDPPNGASTDPQRVQFLEEISELRRICMNQPDEISNVISLAEALRIFDVQYHDGGSAQKEAIDMFHKAIEMAKRTREEMVSMGRNIGPKGEVDPIYGEMLLDYSDRSIDGVLCALYTSLGKTYFMANMFEK
eukprot:scaffold3450_cov114-Cylindrotheca_fusiformis.AAC.7